MGELAFSEKTLAERDPDLRDQFLEGLFDSRIQQKLYEDETERNFCEILQRAQELELIQKNSENKSLFGPTKFDIVGRLRSTRRSSSWLAQLE